MNDRSALLRPISPRIALWCLAGVLAGASLPATAAWGKFEGPVSFEGTWKISAPQSAFKPEGGAIPFTANGRKAYEQNKKYHAKSQYDEYDITQSRCSSPGTPRLMLTPMRFRIYQRYGLVHFSFEWNYVSRMVAMGNFWVPPGGIQGSGVFGDDTTFGSMAGDSTGRWEGDTLVINTVNFADKSLIDNLVPHGFDMKVTERIRLKDANTLEDRITIEDPEHFTRPWSTVVTYTRQSDDAFREDTCLDRLAAGELPLPR